MDENGPVSQRLELPDPRFRDHEMKPTFRFRTPKPKWKPATPKQGF